MSVYCSYCGQRGHNRLGCPQRKAEARANPDGYLARQIAREQEKRKRAVESRTCSYCSRSGHNRRSCALLKEDKRLVLKRQAEYLDEFMASCTESGFGPGSLVMIPRGTRDNPFSKHVVALVTNFIWEEIDFLNSDQIGDSSSWGVRNRSMASARVVGSHGFDADADHWHGPPAQNSVIHLQHRALTSAIGVLMGDPRYENPDELLKVVGPANGAFKVPTAMITNNLNNTFQLDPSKRAKDWEKSRLSLFQPLWSKVRPSEHAAAVAKRNNNA